MVGAHRQAWAWQDEWIGLTMEDIREIERQTQLALQAKMGAAEGGEGEGEDGDEQDASDKANATITPQDSEQVAKTFAAALGSIEKAEDPQSPASMRKPSDIPIINTAMSSEGENSPEDSPTEVLPPRYVYIRLDLFRSLVQDAVRLLLGSLGRFGSCRGKR